MFHLVSRVLSSGINRIQFDFIHSLN